MNCKNCQDFLLNSPEFLNRELVIRCLTCRALNIVTVGLKVTAWREEEAR